MRLFIGIPLAASVAAELAALQARLRSRDDGLRWTAADSWHITLQFLGSTDPERCACLIARLGEVRSARVPVELAGVGAFERSGVFYAGVTLAPELMLLQQRVVAATALCGFAAEERPFRPHITLARMRSHGNPRALRALTARLDKPPTFTPFAAEEFLLFESFLGAAGARHEVRARFGLET